MDIKHDTAYEASCEAVRDTKMYREAMRDIRIEERTNKTFAVLGTYASHCTYAIEMDYDKEDSGSEVIARGNYRGFPFVVVNIGHHNPSAYINVVGTKFDGVDYADIPVECHGGLTYARDYIYTTGETGWWIGWDYAHYGDYDPRMDDGFVLKATDEMPKRWTTHDVVAECISVIDQLQGERREDLGGVRECPFCHVKPLPVKKEGRVHVNFSDRYYDGTMVKMVCPKCGVYVGKGERGEKDYGYATEELAIAEWDSAIHWRETCERVLKERQRAKGKEETK